MELSEIEVSAKQWGVGHGGFHTQTLEVQHRSAGERGKFHVIYDCGSKNRKDWLKQAIDNFTATVDEGDEVVALYISHYDFDHVSGLRHLMERLQARGLRVGTVVAPLLTDLARVVLSIGNRASPRWYRDFLENPRAVLSDMGVGNIVELDGGEGPPDAPLDPPTDETDPAQNAGASATVDAAGRVSVKRGGIEVWEFVPIPVGPPLESDKQKKFWIELPKALGVTGSRSQLTREVLRETAVFEAARVNKAVKATLGHKWANLLSLCLYSGPTGSINLGAIEPDFLCEQELPRSDMARTRATDLGPVSWLGTGDATLNTSEYIGYLKTRLGPYRTTRIRAVGAPHHGSEGNASAELWDSFPVRTVATLHALGLYGHPSEKVVDEIWDSGHLPLHVGLPTQSVSFHLSATGSPIVGWSFLEFP
ncbi:MAG: hypothetical protein C0444_11160 [Microbacterium sp.]|nr:hypothetical protein [Microbacterium sp.]MBA4345366.1 hypothetical protein [Microbacterium sp.]